MTKAEAQWRVFAGIAQRDYASLFDGEGVIVSARAPGRLDVMGGIADYSGSVVLESTIGEATFAAVQVSKDRRLRILSCVEKGPPREAILPLDALVLPNGLPTFKEVSDYLVEADRRRWSAYIAGCLYVLIASGWLEASQATGLNILVRSDVPIGAGVSSSAALEVAVMNALCGLYSVQMDGMELARLCQIVENRVVGAPCGIMDQVTCALGQESALLALKCQPHEILGYPAVPPGWRFLGLDSGVKHSVGGNRYAHARIGAFMGLKVIQDLTGRDWGGYLANITPDYWEEIYNAVPEVLSGSEFAARHGHYPDTVTIPEPNTLYNVRSCTEHPILENDRVRQFIALMGMAGQQPDTALLEEAGSLLVESHVSYSDRVHLGSQETDLLVELILEQGPPRGLYGAKITGGGSGGTVAVLCVGDDADAAIEDIRCAYAAKTGRKSRLIANSSPGAWEFGSRHLT